MGLRYRISQFAQAVRARQLPPTAWQEIESILAPTEVALFRRHAPADRQHAYRVMRTLHDAGYRHRALLAAALLHDVGKARFRLRLWERIAGALAERCCPGRLKVWGHLPEGNGEPVFPAGVARWRRPFIIRAQHPRWGAAMVDAAGSPPLVVTLVRHHQQKERLPDPVANRLLRRLQWADDRN